VRVVEKFASRFFFWRCSHSHNTQTDTAKLRSSFLQSPDAKLKQTSGSRTHFFVCCRVFLSLKIPPASILKSFAHVPSPQIPFPNFLCVVRWHFYCALSFRGHLLHFGPRKPLGREKSTQRGEGEDHAFQPPSTNKQEENKANRPRVSLIAAANVDMYALLLLFGH